MSRIVAVEATQPRSNHVCREAAVRRKPVVKDPKAGGCQLPLGET